jgi:hypothetical protein
MAAVPLSGLYRCLPCAAPGSMGMAVDPKASEGLTTPSADDPISQCWEQH